MVLKLMGEIKNMVDKMLEKEIDIDLDMVIKELDFPPSIYNEHPYIKKYIVERINGNANKSESIEQGFFNNIDKAICAIHKRGGSVDFVTVLNSIELDECGACEQDFIKLAVYIYHRRESEKLIRHIERKVLKQINEYQENDEWISFEKVSNALGIDLSVLYLTPSIRSHIEDAEALYYSSHHIRNNQLLKKVYKALNSMIKNKEKINMTKIAKKAGVSRSSLYESDIVIKLVHEHKEKEKLLMVQSTINEIYESGKLIRTKNLLDTLNLEKSFLTKHQQIKYWVNEKNHELKNEIRLKRVKEIIIMLKNQNQKVNVSQVAREMGVTPSYLYRYKETIGYIKMEQSKMSSK